MDCDKPHLMLNKKRNPPSGQNNQLVYWWLLVHFGPPAGPRNSDHVTLYSVRKPPLWAAFPTSDFFMKFTCLLFAGATGASFTKKFHWLLSC
jgi:hypothetical protein